MLKIKPSEETQELWVRFKDKGDMDAREELIVKYAPLVKYMAGRLAILLPPTVQKDDLTSYGIFGLIDAVEKFDYTRGIKFETYAIARVKGAIWDGLRNMDWVPYSIRQKAKNIEQTFMKLELKLGHPPSDDEVCEYLNITKEQFRQVLMETSLTTMVSLDDLWKIDKSSEDAIRIIDTIEDTNAVNPISFVEFEEKKELLTEVINKLPEREKLVIALYYYEGLTLKEIGKVLGVSESRISQLHTKAIFRLRGRLGRQKKKIFN